MARRALRPSGLRSRLLLALIVTALATLLAAALALFSPLQQRLREQQTAGLRSTAEASRAAIDRAAREDNDELGEVPQIGLRTEDQLRSLENRTGARVIAADGSGTIIYPREGYPDQVDDVRRVLTTNAAAESRVENTIRYALPLKFVPRRRRGDKRDLIPPYLVVALRQPDTQIAETVDEVRRAFVTAVVIGLGVALALGLFLTSTLTRRLGRLRDAAVRMTTEGMSAPPPVDDGPDEVGDLARAMARMQDGLRRQEDARRQFVATASHELRTPLTSLSGNLELLGEDLEDEPFDREAARRQVVSAQGQIRRLRNLSTELLDLSRLDAGVELRSEPVELAEIARAVAAEFALQAHERRTLLEVVPPRGPCWARGDPDAVARVARILIDNALRYTPPSTAVRVETGYAGEGATLAVVDDGPGVPPEERDAIFERFRRGAATRGEGGFGLGLAIGRELAERLGGRLELDGSGGGRLVPGRPGGAGYELGRSHRAHDPPGSARFVLTLPIELPSGGTGGA